MPSEKFFVHKEDGSLVRLKGRLVRFLDEEPPTGSDKSAIRTALEVSPDAEGLVQADVGTAPNEIPVNGMLGSMAYQSSEGISVGTLSADGKTTLTNDQDNALVVETTNKNPMYVNVVGSAPNYLFDVRDDDTSKFRVDGSGNVKLSGDENELQFHSDTGVGDNVRARIQCEGKTGTYGYGGDLVFKTTADNNTSAERLRITSSALVLGSGMAIDFGSGASTTLDAYEHGDITSVTDASGAGLGITADLKYQVIGKSVQISGKIIFPVTADTNAAQVTLLPEQCPNDDGARGLSVSYSTIGSAFYVLPLGGTNDVMFYTVSGSTMSNNALSGVAVFISGNYSIN